MKLRFMRLSLFKLSESTGMVRAFRALLSVNKEFKRPGTAVTNDVRVVELAARLTGLSVAETRRVFKEGLAHIFPKLEPYFYPMPGAADFIRWAGARYALTLATNPVWPEEIIHLRVRWAGIDPVAFASVTHIRSMTACKPSPTYYREILESHGLEAGECLLVGNEVAMDLPATEVGIKTFIIDGEPSGPIQAKVPAARGTFAELQLMLEGAAARRENVTSA